MNSTKIDPKFVSKSNPRVGLIALASDFMIEKDFIKVIKDKDIDFFVNTIMITPIIIITPPMNNSVVGFSPKRNMAANKPVGGIPIVTIGSTLYKGLFFKT